MNSCRNYQTKQKTAIFSLLKEHSESHLTAEQMLTILKDENTPVGKATLYRFLDSLVENGEVNKYVIDNISCYQYVGTNLNSQNCFHLICDHCGKLINASTEDIKRINEKLEKCLDFKIDNTKTVLYGICKDCQVKTNEED
ncbi:MAG: transcriptional repressor [Bacilli bacterium]|nr:transcriptional repressor [Mollicutes bacterium]MDY3899153.1 transcriptional repressor [Bacilli bacterium]